MNEASIFNNERGSVSTEYIVILILVAIISIASWNAYRKAVEEDAKREYQTFGYPPEGS